MSTVTLGRDLPRAIDAELSVLGGVIADNNRLADVAGWLTAGHFSQHWAGLVFTAMLTLAKSNLPIDYVSLKESLGGDFANVGIDKLSKIGEGFPRSTNVEYYGRVVVDHARRREAIARATAVIDAAMEPGATADDVVSGAQESFFKLATSRRGDSVWTAERMTVDAFTEFEELEHRGYEITGLASGIRELDDMTFGFQPGELVIVGARPSVGKSALAGQIALHAASSGHVLFCSLEMKHRSIWSRAVFNAAKVDGYRYRRGAYKGDTSVHAKVAHALEQLHSLKFTLDEQAGQTSTDIRARARQTQLRHGLGLVVVDYLQLMRPSENAVAKKQNRTQEIGEMAWDLKEMAMALNVPVIALSQLRRPKNDDDRPGMSDLRESGDIEAHADIILLLHRKETKAQLDDLEFGQPAHIELIIEKQRGNPTGSLTLLNYRESYRFLSTADSYMEVAS